VISFDPTARPAVSIVIVAYGNWPILERCLACLAANTPRPYEVVIVDNQSPDDTSTHLQEDVTGARIVSSGENIGFAAGCNAGAAVARAPLLCFLNGDAFVQPGWLEPLVETVGEPGVGASVPLLLNEDGTVQEAGSVVDADGWALALGSGQRADDPEYAFQRDVDFGSAACLMTPRIVFSDVDGFERSYGVGYYEDVDLCFKLAERRLRTRLDPRARVVHVRFGSSDAARARAQVQRNRLRFLERWCDRLADRPQLRELPTHPHRLLAARDLSATHRLLVIDDRVPNVDRGSGDPRMAKLLVECAALWPRHRITLLAATSIGATKYAAPLLDAGIEVVAPPRDWPAWFESREFHYSTVIVSRVDNAERFRHLLRHTQPQALRIFDAEALAYRRLERQAALLGDSPAGHEMRVRALDAHEAELSAVEEADIVFTVSPEEREVVELAAPEKPVYLLPSYVTPAMPTPGFNDRDGFVFFGGFLAGKDSPNEDAVIHLVQDVMPIVWESEPDARLTIIGADPTEDVLGLASSKVDVVGYVADPAEYLTTARVHIHPMRFGAGIKLKLLETMAAGLPFVTTPVGAEGIELGPIRGQLVANEPVSVAANALALYRDQQLWHAVQKSVLSIVDKQFSRASFRTTLAAALAHAGMYLEAERSAA
jgi:GT2 family glycosyltransferase